MAFPKIIAGVLAAGVFAAAFAIPAPNVASAADRAVDPLRVVVDRAKVVRIAKPADTVIIGNPAIVDATVQDARTLVLTGRSFGVTNLIVLDINGDPIVDETVVVTGHETNTVRIYRRSVRETLACSPVCEPTLTIGDDSNTFSATNNQIKDRNQLSDDSAETN
ncbi:MAG: pilus assembly protein N-terminal domain-containing protein [Ahrensia sp.]|nr:pilus assembly protein N-terminal domain-containing protein [Ahrensia sp.]